MKRGFSLIEVIVAISVLVILMGISLPALNAARERARDSRRISDIQEIYFSLRLYQKAQGGLPLPTSYGESNSGGWDYSSQGGFLSFLTGVMPSLPVDPTNNGSGDVLNGGSGYAYGYICNQAERSLSLGVRLERPDEHVTKLGDNLINGVFWIANRERGYTCL